jgi:hypothetical protein
METICGIYGASYTIIQWQQVCSTNSPFLSFVKCVMKIHQKCNLLVRGGSGFLCKLNY